MDNLKAFNVDSNIPRSQSISETSSLLVNHLSTMTTNVSREHGGNETPEDTLHRKHSLAL